LLNAYNSKVLLTSQLLLWKWHLRHPPIIPPTLKVKFLKFPPYEIYGLLFDTVDIKEEYKKLEHVEHKRQVM
jgi:hypothetical protein